MKKKIKNKSKTAIGPESVDDQTDPDKEDKQKRKIPALVMWYLLVIDHLKCVFSNHRNAELVHCIVRSIGKIMRRFDTLRMELSGIFFIFIIHNLQQRVEI
jgi:hypothetical protein